MPCATFNSDPGYKNNLQELLHLYRTGAEEQGILLVVEASKEKCYLIGGVKHPLTKKSAAEIYRLFLSSNKRNRFARLTMAHMFL